MRILVLDGNENQAVACVRSLSRAGHHVIVGAASSWSKAGWSRRCSGTFTYPAPEDGADAFVDRIAGQVRIAPGTLVLPMTERSTLPLSAGRKVIYAAGGRLVLPPHAAVLQAFDKHETTRLAESVGVAVPRTWLIDDAKRASEAASSLPYPVVLKPRSSERVSFHGGVSATGRPAYARTPGEFMSAYKEVCLRSPEVLVQEFIEGAGGGYFALMREGELRAEFAHIRVRDVYPTGSGSSVRMSVRPSQQLRDAGLQILRGLQWHGVAMVEFRVPRDGAPVFMEVNGRFWASLALAVHAGVDFPALLARLAELGDVETPPPYREGIRCRWLLGDFRHLLEVWRGAPARYPGAYPARLRTLISFLVPVPGTAHDNFQWRDPLPEIGDWLGFVSRRVLAARRRTKAPGESYAERRYSHP